MASKNYTAAATGAVAGPIDAGAGNTKRQLNLRVMGANDATVALETSPDNTAWTEQCRVTGGQFGNWGYAASNHARRYARVNVIFLGTGGTSVSATVSYY